jgi:hypothetical protein
MSWHKNHNDIHHHLEQWLLLAFGMTVLLVLISISAVFAMLVSKTSGQDFVQMKQERIVDTSYVQMLEDSLAYISDSEQTEAEVLQRVQEQLIKARVPDTLVEVHLDVVLFIERIRQSGDENRRESVEDVLGALHYLAEQ